MQTLSLSALLLCTFSVPQISEGMVQGLQEDGLSCGTLGRGGWGQDAELPQDL